MLLTPLTWGKWPSASARVSSAYATERRNPLTPPPTAKGPGAVVPAPMAESPGAEGARIVGGTPIGPRSTAGAHGTSCHAVFGCTTSKQPFRPGGVWIMVLCHSASDSGALPSGSSDPKAVTGTLLAMARTRKPTVASLCVMIIFVLRTCINYVPRALCPRPRNHRRTLHDPHYKQIGLQTPSEPAHLS